MSFKLWLIHTLLCICKFLITKSILSMIQPFESCLAVSLHFINAWLLNRWLVLWLLLDLDLNWLLMDIAWRITIRRIRFRWKHTSCCGTMIGVGIGFSCWWMDLIWWGHGNVRLLRSRWNICCDVEDIGMTIELSLDVIAIYDLWLRWLHLDRLPGSNINGAYCRRLRCIILDLDNIFWFDGWFITFYGTMFPDYWVNIFWLFSVFGFFL